MKTTLKTLVDIPSHILEPFGIRSSGTASYSFENETQPRRYSNLHSKNLLKRIIILILMSIIGTGLYFEYDIPGSLQNQIMKEYDIGPYAFSYLYSVYAWPNCIMCFLNGFFMDRFFGVQIGLIVYLSVSVLGQAVFIIGCFVKQFIVLLTGRFIYGIGCESSVVGTITYSVLWFKDHWLNAVMAIILNIGRLGSAMVFESSVPTYNAMARIEPEQQVLTYTLTLLASMILVPLIASVVAALLKPENNITQDSNETKENDHEKQKESSEIGISDFLRFPITYWLLMLYGSILISTTYSFLAQAQAIFTQKFQVSDDTANSYTSFFNFLSAGLSPCMGFCIDKLGRNYSYIILSFITEVIGVSLITFTNASPFFGMFFLAVAVSALYAANWGMFSFLIPEHQLGTAFGIAQAGMNAGLSIGTVAAGAIANEYGFEIMNSVLLGVMAATLPALLWCWVLDKRGNGVLNMSAKQRAMYKDGK